MDMIYIVAFEIGDEKHIAKIFDSREKAEDYIKKQRKFFPDSDWKYPHEGYVYYIDSHCLHYL